MKTRGRLRNVVLAYQMHRVRRAVMFAAIPVLYWTELQKRRNAEPETPATARATRQTKLQFP